jgi:chitodextrinase
MTGLLWTHGSAEAAITFVQGRSATPQAPATTVSTTFTSAQIAGDLNVVIVGWNDATSQVASVTDSKGNVYTRAVGPTVQAGTASQSIYYAANVAAAAANGNTITVTFNTPANYVDLRIAAYRGVAATNPVDVVAAAQGNGASSDSGAVTTTNANDLIVGGNLVQTLTTGAGSGFTNRMITAPDGDILEDRIVTAVGSYKATATILSGPWIMQMVAFRAATTSGDTQSPTTPAGLSATAATSSTINLSWTASTDNVGVTGYQIERCLGVSCSTFASIGTSPTTTFGDSGLAGASTYVYRVRATDAAGNVSGYSTTATATTPAAADTTAPSTPAGLTPSVVSTTAVNLAWSASTDNVGVTGYHVERCQGSGCSNFSEIGVAATAAYADGGLTAATTYRYRVRAADAAGNLSGYSTAATATTQAAADTQAPTTPAGLTPSVTSSSAITLTWTASSDNVGVTGYLVERCQGTGCSTFAQVGTPTGASFADSGLQPSTNYSYRVRASDAAGNQSAFSAVVNATTQAAPATISFVQVNAATPQVAQTSVAIPYTLAQSAGGLNVVIVGWNDTVAHVSSVTDSEGNVYARAVGPTLLAGQASQSIYYAKNIAAAAPGANTVTIAFDAPAQYVDARIAEYSGADPVNPFDVAIGNSGTGGTSSAGPLTTTGANELLVAGNVVLTQTTAAGAGFTRRIITLPDADILEDGQAPTAGAYTATASISSGGWVMQVAAFRVASGTGPIPTSDLTVGKTHTGTFSQGQIGASYSLAVSNVGSASTTGTVTVTDALPSGLTATAIGGNGWSCSLATTSCTRSDALAAAGSYPAVTVTVDVAAGAAPSVTNVATVSGGGETNSANNSASDVTTITSAPDTEAPSAPGTLHASVVSGIRVDLSWGAATDNIGVAGYRLERCVGVGCTVYSKLGTTITGTSFSDTTLSPSTTYGYIVRAQDAAGNLGPYSNPVSVTTSATNPNLVTALSFDEGTGTTVTDLSGYGNNGTVTNATWSASGKFGKALTFNGTSAVVTVPNSASLQLTSGMTVEAWVYPTGTNTGWRDVIYKADDNYYLEASTSNGTPGIGIVVGGQHTEAITPTPLAANTWTFLSATYDGTTLRMYVNGTQVGSQPVTGPIVTSNNPLQIGGDSLYGQYFSGMIDEVRVYNTALSPAQIQADMAMALGGSAPLFSATPTSLDFAEQDVHVGSTPRAVTITNTGASALTVTGVTVSGAQATDFSQTNTCVGSLAPAANCTIDVVFTPGAGGVRNATITVADNAVGNPHTISLTGTGSGFTIAPQTSVIVAPQGQQFVVTGNGGSGVTWSVDGVAGGTAATGTVTAGGLYTPPAVAGTHTVTVTTTDGLKTATGTVFVTTNAGMYTHHNDNGRTGQNLTENVLTLSNVKAATFGKLASFATDGIAHASPLYVANVNIPGVGVRNVVYVATEHDSVYAFDANGGGVLWHNSYINPAAGITTVPNGDTGECCDITPEIGITGTPVIDPSTNTMYVVVKTKENTNYRQRLHALDIATGAEKFGGPVLIQATVPGTGTGSVGGQLAFDSLRENERTAVLLYNGVVYFGFGSHGDYQPYHGWLLGYNATTLQQVMAFASTPNGEGGGIWQSGGGLAIDGNGNFFFATGDGTFNINSGGKDYGDTFLKFNPSSGVIDWFTPHDQNVLDVNNLDLDAGGMILLPDQPGAHPHIMISAGKSGSIYVVDRDNMTHFNATDRNVQTLVNAFPFGTPLPGNYSSPVYFNGTVYFGPVADVLQAFKLTNGLLSTAPTSTSQQAYAYPGGALAISANGTSNGILWAVEKKGAAPGALHAYDASNLAVELYNSDQASGGRDSLADPAAKFSIPLVINGQVFVASEGRLTIYGLLP